MASSLFRIATLAFACALTAATFGPTSTVEAQRRTQVVVVRQAPPPPRAHRARPRPQRSDAVWVEGHWEWNGRAHVWREGYYVNPRRGYVYVQPHWEQRRDGWVYVEGTWQVDRRPNRGRGHHDGHRGHHDDHHHHGHR
jgi:hypothetical protein